MHGVIFLHVRIRFRVWIHIRKAITSVVVVVVVVNSHKIFVPVSRFVQHRIKLTW